MDTTPFEKPGDGRQLAESRLRLSLLDVLVTEPDPTADQALLEEPVSHSVQGAPRGHGTPAAGAWVFRSAASRCSAIESFTDTGGGTLQSGSNVTVVSHELPVPHGGSGVTTTPSRPLQHLRVHASDLSPAFDHLGSLAN